MIVHQRPESVKVFLKAIPHSHKKLRYREAAMKTEIKN